LKRKSAVITVELVDESAEETSRKIEQELRDWFEEGTVSIPWVKTVRDITVENGKN